MPAASRNDETIMVTPRSRNDEPCSFIMGLRTTLKFLSGRVLRATPARLPGGRIENSYGRKFSSRRVLRDPAFRKMKMRGPWKAAHHVSSSVRERSSQSKDKRR